MGGMCLQTVPQETVAGEPRVQPGLPKVFLEEWMKMGGRGQNEGRKGGEGGEEKGREAGAEEPAEEGEGSLKGKVTLPHG